MASTILAGPAGALGFTGELAADLLEASTLIKNAEKTHKSV
jgi:hypothetical protein